MAPADFEESVRRQLTVEKLRASLTDWLSIPDKDVEQESGRHLEAIGI